MGAVEGAAAAAVKCCVTDKLPTSNDVSRALKYLSETDERYGWLVAAVKASEHKGKTAKALAFLSSEGTMAEKEAKSLASEDYKSWVEDYQNIVAECETIRARRKRAELVIEVWRSANSNRRQGIQV